MICVVAVESRKSTGLCSYLFDGLSDLCETLLLDGNEIRLEGEQPELMLVRQKAPISCSMKLITVVGGALCAQAESPAGSVCVVSSDNKRQLSALCKTGIPVVTCGMSEKDTFTCTSRTSDSAVIALQRSVCDFNGNEILPFELPVRLNENIPVFFPMALTAIRCLAGI